jgi:photosystem II stability/assembly factor-like uncharacterized protein
MAEEGVGYDEAGEKGVYAVGVRAEQYKKLALGDIVSQGEARQKLG